MTIKIEVGRYYRDKLGITVLIVCVDPWNPEFYIGIMDTMNRSFAKKFFADGRCYASPNDFSLVTEVQEGKYR